MTTPIEIVTAFLAEWGKSTESMLASYGAYFTPETIWENVGISTSTGIDEAIALLGQFDTTYGVKTIEVDMINISYAGNVVMTERIDRLIAADGLEVMAIRLMGVFEVENGKVVHWRDYFDNAAIVTP